MDSKKYGKSFESLNPKGLFHAGHIGSKELILAGEEEAIATLVAPEIYLILASLCFSPAEQMSITKETKSFLCHSELKCSHFK